MRPWDGRENNVIYYISLLARAQYLIEKFVSERLKQTFSSCLFLVRLAGGLWCQKWLIWINFLATDTNQEWKGINGREMFPKVWL